MFLTNDLDILDLLLLSDKLQHCKNIYLWTIIIRLWPKLLIEIRKIIILQICKHECNGPSKPPSPSLKKCVVASIHYLLNKFLKRPIEALFKIKIIYKKWKNMFLFCSWTKEPQELFSWNFFFDHSFGMLNF